MKSSITLLLLAAVVYYATATPLSLSPITKPGSCPSGPPVVGICAITDNSCETDGQCVGDQKCCSNGCGKFCVSVNASPTRRPVQPPRPVQKAGVCPANDVVGICAITENSCQNDGECTGDLLCCSSRCGRACVRPTRGPIQPQPVEKPGACPANDSVGICVFDPDRNCLSDSACPGSQKCCSNDCNRVCTNVRHHGPAPVHFAQ